MTRPTFLALTAAAGAMALGLLAANLGSVAPRAVARTTPAAAPAAPSLPAAPNAAAVVDAANAFLASLSDEQRAVAQIALTPRLAARWTNFPGGSNLRNGVFFRELTAEQVAAALKVARLALSEEGFTRFQEVRAADDAFAKGGGGRGPGGRGPGGRGPGGPGGPGGSPPKGAGGPGGPGGVGKSGRGPGGPGGNFGSANYMIAFLGKPSQTTPWLLQLGGHHLAFNIYYKGTTSAATPYHVGVQPNTWTDPDGKKHAPLAPMRDAMHDLVNSLAPDQSKRARLDARFNDVYVGPGRDGQFPARSEGVPVSELSDESKNLVKGAIAAWTGDSAQGAEYRTLYDAELDRTKVAYSGSTAVDDRGDYVRIDGPHVWIEFACQGSDHYHTIWRDRATDYGAEFSF
ncbi:MAG TPA: DUF3500 domain-containing protein [Isosphaeraceae bacterium]|jgi:hypothetical protein